MTRRNQSNAGLKHAGTARNWLAFNCFGPVSSGSVGDEAVTVLFGPPGTGKALVAGAIGTVAGFDADACRKATGGGNADGILTALVRRGAGYSPGGSIRIMKGGSVANELDFDSENVLDHAAGRYSLLAGGGLGTPRRCVHVPTERVQVARGFHDTMLRQFKEFSTVMKGGGVWPALSEFGKSRPATTDLFDALLAIHASLPADVQFHVEDIIGYDVRLDGSGIKSLVFSDGSGCTTGLAGAPASALSLLSIFACCGKMLPNGALVVEEPEIGLDTTEQAVIMERLVLISRAFNARLVVTTHSKHVVKKMLSMVGSGVGSRDVGLYRFGPVGKAVIEQIGVSREGKTDQPVFREDAGTPTVGSFSNPPNQV